MAAGVALLLALFAGDSAPKPDDARAGGNTFHCSFDASCPEVPVAGDPYAQIGGNPAPFRGYGDPSLEYDPDTGELWLAYSWLDVLISDPGPPAVVDFGVRTHIAKSTDNGATWAYDHEVNATLSTLHPDTSAQGWTIHEVSTIARRGAGDWEALWLTYFDPFGPAPERSDFYYTRSLATAPEDLGDVATPWIRTNGTSASWGVTHNLSAMPELADCTALTEPGLFALGGATYLLTNCVVFDGPNRQPQEERLVLLREGTSGYSFAGTLLDYDDAADLGGERVEQADLALSANGAILLFVTPIQATQPEHLGCTVMEVTDLETAEVRRDSSGEAVRLFEFTGDGAMGPGGCTYDRENESGALMVLRDLTPSPFDLEFSIRATGVHPLGIDSDSDGLADTADGDDDNDALSDAIETACGSNPLIASSVPERTDGAFAGLDEDGDTLIDEALPAGGAGADCDRDGYVGSAETHVFSSASPGQDPCGTGAWPADLIGGAFSGNRVNVQDLATFLGPVRYLNTDVGTHPGDVRWDVVPGSTFGVDINIQDLAQITVVAPPMLGVRALSGPDCPWPP
jgi:hypothetical protein